MRRTNHTLNSMELIHKVNYNETDHTSHFELHGADHTSKSMITLLNQWMYKLWNWPHFECFVLNATRPWLIHYPHLVVLSHKTTDSNDHIKIQIITNCNSLHSFFGVTKCEWYVVKIWIETSLWSYHLHQPTFNCFLKPKNKKVTIEDLA